MVIEELVLRSEKKKALVEAHVGVKFVVAIHHVFKNMIYTYADNVLGKLQTPWDLKN